MSRKFPFDGILGLSPDVSVNGSYLTMGKPMPVFLKDKKRIADPIVALDMRKGEEGGSSIQIGRFD